MQPINNRQTARQILLAIGVFLMIVFVFYIIGLFGFRVVSTNPSTSDVATATPFLDISFSRPLASRGLSISSSYSVISNYRVSGSILYINLKSPMTQGYKYSVTIKYITDTNGDHITNKSFDFTPKYVAYQDLPQDQQRALLNTQRNHPVTKSSVQYENFDTLINYGMSSYQANVLQQDFYEFSSKALVVNINPASVSPVPHNPDSSSTNEVINFLVLVDNNNYRARATYSDFGNDAHLQLYNPQNNTLVFNSDSVPSINDRQP